MVTAVAAEADSVAAGLVGRASSSAAGVLPSGHAVTRLSPSSSPEAPTGTATGPEPGPSAPTAPTAGPYVDIVVGGAGPAAAAVGATSALATTPYDLVVSAGIGGGFAPRAPLGALVVSDAIIAADLGADTPEGYLAVEELGFGRSAHLPPAGLIDRVAEALRAGGLPHLVAPVLTVSTVTGTAARTSELTARHPGAGAEGMEGFGVAEAAAAYGVPVVELRAISNTVGPRDRAAWRIGPALDSLRQAFRLLGTTVFPDLEAP
ncbi:futalosine hydrolase [Streptomyces sp. SP18CS02]|uniref:futalosine hydrolase n=1 Tax=Streptomyces sp. SP18CS02 TaxID=3002531 RepID=UPI002E77F83B|nr:futalosine hydrolase [Streptomyces sp. SP18CS02]MEE1755688.1 futalosine hydrolase [Streptomyces sp. SP18CS02]